MPGRPTCVLGALVLACGTIGGDGFAGPIPAGKPRAPLVTGGGATATSRRSTGLLRMAAEKEKEKEKDGVAMEAPSDDQLGDDKLIYDARSGRFYEKKLEEVCREEYCAIDETTGEEDLFRRFSTYLPANFIFGLAFLGISWQILEPVRYLNPLATLLLLTAPTIAASKKFTDLCLYQDNGTVASGPCPSCGVQNVVFFGSMLGVKGNIDEADFNCVSCKETIKIRRADLRARTLPKV
eukprot:g10228.t1